jgi:hypothetical protein
MAYIPKDARWYVADIVLELVIKGDPRSVVHVNTVLVEADSPEEAYQRAQTLGREEEQEYANTEGKPVRVMFRGLRELNVIHDKLEHGAELYYREFTSGPDAKADNWTRPKDQLAVFSHQDRSKTPNYMPESVMNLLEKRGVRRVDIERPQEEQ